MAARLFAGAALGPAHWLPTAGGDGDGGPPLVAAAFTDSDTGVEGLGVLGLAPAGAAGAAGDVALEWRGAGSRATTSTPSPRWRCRRRRSAWWRGATWSRAMERS